MLVRGVKLRQMLGCAAVLGLVLAVVVFSITLLLIPKVSAALLVLATVVGAAVGVGVKWSHGVPAAPVTWCEAPTIMLAI